MTPQAQLALLVWMPIVIYFFIRFPSHRAVVVSFIVAWLFLPEKAGFSLTGLPDYTKTSATCYGILLATAIFDFQRFSSFKLGWIDLPMLVWCLSPFVSSITNDLGAYDGLSSALSQSVAYGIPYFLGRIYLNNLSGLRQLAMGIFVGGLVYVPFCLFEIRMSPQLHRIVYGYFPLEGSFATTMRLGGWRPQVFMQSGLAVGMWMMAATLIGIWLWQAGVLEKLWDIPIKWLVLGLLITFVLVKSTGAYIYLAYGILVMFIAKQFRTALPLLFLIFAISLYLFLGVSGSFYGKQADQIVSIASNIAGPDRAQSLEFRLDNEERLTEKARQKMLFGWGGWGRSRIYEENWDGDLVDISVTDSLWILAFGPNGLVGLIALYSSLLLPVLIFSFRYPASTWFNPKVAPAAALSVVICLYMLDCLLNAMPNPVFILACGGIAGLVLAKPEKLRKRSDRTSKTRPVALKRGQLKRRVLQGK